MIVLPLEGVAKGLRGHSVQEVIESETRLNRSDHYFAWQTHCRTRSPFLYKNALSRHLVLH
jgi:hypothetical protein